MKVRCTKLIDAFGDPQEQSAWLTIGKVYHVLSVYMDTDSGWLLRLIGDTHPGVGLFPLEQFEIVSPKIPNRWIVTWNGGVFELTTVAWNEPGYWELYYDDDSDALATFDREAGAIIAADP